MFPLSLIKQAIIYILNHDGHYDTSFMRNCKQIIESESLPENSLSNIFKNLVTEVVDHKKPIDSALAALISIDFTASEIIDTLKTETIDSNQLSILKQVVNETVSTLIIMNNVKKVQDISTKIINKELTTSTEIKTQFQSIMGELFTIMSTLDRSSADEEIEISSDNIEQVIEHMKNYLEKQKIVIPTGLTYLDTYLDGGFHNSRLYTLVMKSGDGKSLTMLSLAQHMQKQVIKGTPIYDMIMENLKEKSDIQELKPTVYYFTFENSVDETLERYLPELAEGSVGSVESFEKNIDKIKENLSKYDLHLKVKYKGGFTTSPVDVIQYLENQKVKGFYPVAIFIDYLGIMISGDGSLEKRLQLEKITAGLKNIAVMYNCPVTTGVQVKKDSFDKSELKESDIKESSGIIDNSDVIIGAWQGEMLHETYLKQMNFTILKQRNFVKGIKFTLGVDFTRFQLFNLTQDQQDLGQNKMPATYDPSSTSTMANQIHQSFGGALY